MRKEFREYKYPNGKWGWFHFYNPVTDKFANTFRYCGDNILIDNLWIWEYQKIALTAIFGARHYTIKEEELLKHINDSISKIYEFVNNTDEFKTLGIFKPDSFLMQIYLLAKDYKKVIHPEILQNIIAGLYVLLAIDVIIRDSQHCFIENIILISHHFQEMLKILNPAFDIKRRDFVNFGKQKGETKRNQVISDYGKEKDNFWQEETKFEGKINLLMQRYNIGETTAKKYYKMIKNS